MTSLTSRNSSRSKDGGRTSEDYRTRFSFFISYFSFFILLALPLNAQDSKSEDTKEKILADQQRLAEQYELLEQKLFSLYQYEQDQNPERSELLQKAYQTSREKLTLEKFNAAVQQLRQSRFRIAEKNQDQITNELQGLLDLLQSEDRSQRVRDQIDRYKEYIKEINRILRIQQGIRGQRERGDDGQKLRDDQQRNADRTGKLDRNIKENESDRQESDADSRDPAENSGQSQAEPGQAEQGQAEPGQAEQGQQNQQGQQGEQGQHRQGQQDQHGDPQQPSENPVQQKLQQAEQKMREAQQKMEEAKKEESLDKMRDAERELQQAKRELERILRQLREEEIKRSLASLESRFRRMLELQIKIYDDTAALDVAQETSPRDEIEIQAGKLAVREKGLVTEAARALLVLEDDGSSIAISESVRQAQMDMQQVADRLSAAKTDSTTQEIQQSIIETLGYLVEVFEQAQKDENSQKPPGQGQKQGQPGEQALINQLAELKLIRGLQQQILKRHSRYSELLQSPNDSVGHASDPAIRKSLEQLSQRQQKLQQITHDIVVGKNR